MTERNRPRPIERSGGSRITVVLGRTGDDYALLLDQDDGDTRWQSCHWDMNNLEGLSGQLLKQIHNCHKKGRYVTQMSIDPEDEKYYIAGERRDGSSGYRWWDAHFDRSDVNGSDVRVFLGDDGRWVALKGSNGYNYSDIGISSDLVKRMKRINRKRQHIDFLKLLPHNGYFISDSEGAEWTIPYSPHLSKELKSGSDDEVLDVIVALDGSWLVIRPDHYVSSRRVSNKLTSALTKFYVDHRRRKSNRKKEIDAYDAALQRENEEREEAERIRLAILRQQAEEKAKWEREELEKARRKRLEEMKRMAEIEAVRKRRAEGLRVLQFQQKRLKVGDRITAIGHSTSPGDLCISAISNDGVTVDRNGQELTIADPRLVTSYREQSLATQRQGDSSMLVLLCQAQSKYEAAVSLFHCECHDGVCQCTRIAHGTVSFPESSQLDPWLPGQRVHVKGFPDAVIESVFGQHKIKIRYKDYSTYHVSADALKRIGSVDVDISSQAMQLLEDSAEKSEPFDEFKCAEKIDVRRLQSVVNDLTKDSGSRRECIRRLRSFIDDDDDTDGKLQEWLKHLERCQCLEMTAKTLHEMLNGLPRDKNGCVVHEVAYEQRDASFRGRLFAIGRTVKTGLEEEKYPRIVTLQGMHNDLRAPLVGAFAHDIDCKNSDVRILCSLATQLDLTDVVPTLFDYRNRREYWLGCIWRQHEVTRDAAKRLVSIMVSGGNYFTWLRNVKPGRGMLPPRQEIKTFAFKLQTQLDALRDQLVAHPRFRWTGIDREKLQADGKKDDMIDGLLLARIVFSCENEVLGMLHRSFDRQGWKVRAKVFDGLIVEAGETSIGLGHAMRIAESECKERRWDIELEEKSLFGKQDDDIESIVAARKAQRSFDKWFEDYLPPLYIGYLAG